MLQMSLEVDFNRNVRIVWISNAVALESRGSALLISELLKSFIAVA
jgi:hypothetical protein